MKTRETKATARPGAYGPSTIARICTIAIFVSAPCVAIAILILAFTGGSALVAQSASLAGISESAHAATLSERVVRDVLRIASARHGGMDANELHADLNDAATNLDKSLASLNDASAGATRQRLASLRDAWSPIRKELALIGDFPSGKGALDRVVDRTLAFGPELGDALAALRADFAAENDAHIATATALRRLVSGLALAFLAILALAIALRFGDAARETKHFAGMLERMVADLAKRSLRLGDDRRDHTVIMESTGHGMFVLGHDLRIKPPFAREVCELFGTDDVAGRAIQELLRPFVGERKIAEIEAYLPLLFRTDVTDERLNRDHPLQEIEITHATADGHAVRYLAFAFRRVREDDAIVSTFVSIDDVSERVRLARELMQSERRRERQTALLQITSALTNDQLTKFLSEASVEARRMADVLRAEDMALVNRGYVEILRERLGSLALSADRLKKLAHGIGFFYLYDLASAFEKRIGDVRASSYVDSDAFLAIVVSQAELRSEIEEIGEFRRRFLKVAS